MGTELVGPCVKGDNMEISSIPPGFESLVPFTLKKVQNSQSNGYSGPGVASNTQKIKLETGMELYDNLKPTNPVTRVLGVKCNQIDSTSGDESEAAQHMLSKQRLPKGVIRGCEACGDCQKVTAKWHPEEARRPDLVDAPVFYPSEEEFEDTLKYISSIRSQAEVYGICRIVPPPSWKPPSPLKEKDIWEKSKFATRVQRIDKLQNRESMRKVLQFNQNKRRKKRRCMKNGADYGNNDDFKFPGEVGFNEAEWFGFEPGPEFTLDAFQKYATDFKAQYFRNDNSSSEMGGNMTVAEEQWQPSIETIEGEYWRMVEKPTEEIEVLYGADLETGAFGSGFPKNSQQVNSNSDNKYISSGWNLNNFPRLPGSVLSFESSDISGVLVPWLYIGMCFSSFCWHVEDHHLYSLNYMHWGDPKMWYGVPGSDALKLESAMRKHLPDLFEEQPDLLHKLITQLSPSILRREGVPVYRCIQKPGEFVLTFPRAYHAGFNCGFNCAEAVNVAPVDWLPHGQNAIELYRETARKTSISHDKLLLGAAREAVRANWEYNLLRKYTSNNLRWRDVCGKDGILSKALKARVDMERARREFLCRSQALKMESSFDANSERECSVCFFDLHLSAAGCHNCSPEKYACLNHAKHLCSCSWGSKFFLFRYDITELNILVEALEGKLSAVYRWARLDLGLALSSYVLKDKNKPNPGLKVSPTAGEPVPKDANQLVPKGANPLPAPSSSKEQKEHKDQANGDILNSIKSVGGVGTSQNVNPPVVVLALENVKAKDNSLKPPSKYKSKVKNLKTPSPEKSALERPEKLKDVILLSDDEGDVPVQEHSVVNEISVKQTGSAHKTFNVDNVGSSTIKSPSKITVIGPSATVDKKHASISQCVQVEDHGNTEISSNKCVLRIKRSLDSDQGIADAGSKQQCDEGEKSNRGDGDKKLYDVDLRSTDNIQTIPCSSSGSPNNLDRYYRQKGPRIAKVVRRINCNIEPLDFGVVREGKFWCDSRAIYPKGFRSRVKYIDVMDPTNVCYYVSEILDAGRDGPLFMVSVEHTPSEVFIHVSAARCWEMVRERVNQEITKQHKLGRPSLPPLQPPGSLDGMEMFGFTSPAILQVIQSKDQNRVCVDYWKSRPLMQIPQQPHPGASGSDSSLKSEPVNDHEAGKSHPGAVRLLDGLFKKASPEELQTLYSLIHKKNSTDEQSLLIQLLNKEIHKHPG